MVVAVGLDIGADSVKAVALNVRGRTVTLNRFARISTEDLAQFHHDIEDPAGRGQAVAEWLKQQNFPRYGLHCGVAGRDSNIRYSNLPMMPPWRLKLIMEHEIADVAEKAGESLTSDFAIIPVHRAQSAFCVMIALAKDAAIEPQMASLSHADIDVASGQPNAVALGDSLKFIGDPTDSGFSVVVNIGQRSTDVSVLESGNVVFARSVSLGGHAFTEEIADHYSISEEDAEHYKLEKVGPDGKTLAPVVRSVTQKLGGMLSSTLHYMKVQLELDDVEPERVIVTGGAARLPGLASSLGSSLGCEGVLWDPLAGIECSTAPAADQELAKEHGIEAAVAAGCALKGAMDTATALDLLPVGLRDRREWRHRTRWLIAAAVVIAIQGLVSTGMAYVRNNAELQRKNTIQNVNRARVNKRTKAHEEYLAANKSREDTILALGSRTRAGVQTQEIIKLLARVTPTNMTLTKVKMREVETGEKVNPSDLTLKESPEIEFLITGEVNNLQLLCEQQLADLEELLQQNPSVESAKTTPTGDTQNTKVPFELIIRPQDPQD